MADDTQSPGRKVILVVEDNTDELMIYTTLLGYHGYTILTATDYDSGLEVARGQRPDLAVVDVNLGEGARDGCDLVQALRADPDTRAMPLIAHTAFADVYGRTLGEAGCDVVIHKPSDPMMLLREVARLIGPGDATAAAPGAHTA
jgi:two-component system, cell cycle response regulator DivK